MMTFKKRRVQLVSVVSVVALCAFVLASPPGISAASEKQRPSVTFPHETHMGEYECLRCHHKYEDGENVLEEDALMDVEPDADIVLDMAASAGEAEGEIKCLACHTDGNSIQGMEAFHDMCMGCHKTSKKGPALCGECHMKP